jgi:spore germination cell wall hydrolase CwlJ-like protein
VYAPKQFSWTWTLSDPSPRDLGAYQMATNVAIDVLKERIEDNTNGADHYHADYVEPYWATPEYMIKTATIGNHIFYKAK